METFGFSRGEIFNSRDESFLPDLMRETQGRGVDVVLNSLSGELLHASWRCVAPRGKVSCVFRDVCIISTNTNYR